MPKVTVVVPVYDVEKYINRCVDSILVQTYDDFELILVDDGSPDNCGVICDEYAKKDARITVIHKENGGLSDARNAGIEWSFANSDSEWITFIDSDDWVHPRYLESLLEANLKNGTGISMGVVLVTEDQIVTDGDPGENITVENPNDAFRDETLDPSSCCCRMFRKELFREIRFPVGKLHEDAFVTHRLYFKYDRVSVVHFPLYFYFVNNDGITRSEWNPRKMDVLEAAEDQISFFMRIDNSVMLDYVTDRYIHLILANMRKIKGKREFSEYNKTMRRKLKRTLRENKKMLGLTFSKDYNIYKYAYPFAAKIYRRMVRGNN